MKKNLDIQGETGWQDQSTIDVKNHTITSGKKLVVYDQTDEFCSRLVIHHDAAVEVKDGGRLIIGYIKNESGKILAVNKEQVPKEQLLMCPSGSIDIRKGGQVDMREKTERISVFAGSGKGNVTFENDPVSKVPLESTPVSGFGLIDKESVSNVTLDEMIDNTSDGGSYLCNLELADLGLVNHEESEIALGLVDHGTYC